MCVKVLSYKNSRILTWGEVILIVIVTEVSLKAWSDHLWQLKSIDCEKAAVFFEKVAQNRLNVT